MYFLNEQKEYERKQVYHEQVRRSQQQIPQDRGRLFLKLWSRLKRIISKGGGGATSVEPQKPQTRKKMGKI